MLAEHLNAQEKKLMAEFESSSSSGHNVNKGNAREQFVKTFLENHLAATVAIGAGEIIDSDSQANEQRNQHDVIIYRNCYPKLHLGKDDCFLAESVIATIEVKSKLSEKDLRQAVVAAQNSKKLKRNINSSIQAGYLPPGILNYLVAYQGPEKMETIVGWLKKIEKENNFNSDIPKTEQERWNTTSGTIDGIFVLNKGFVYFDNSPISFFEHDYETPQPIGWNYSNTEKGNLVMLFTLLQQAVSNFQASWVNLIPYLKRFDVNVQQTKYPSYGLGRKKS